MGKLVRMADVAQKLGISVVSVSKALAGKEGVSDEMRARIIQTAKELGYVAPVRTKEKQESSGTIGIVVADRFFSDNTFYANLYRLVVMQCAALGYSAVLEIVEPEFERSCQMPNFLVNKRVDGLIFMGVLSHTYLPTATSYNLPYMLLDFYVDQFTADCVVSSNVEGGWVLTNHLLQTGRRQIGFVGSILSTTSIMDRYLGYVKAQLQAGITPRDDWRLEDRDASGRFIPIKLPEEMPQAFVCSCDEVAFNLMEMLKRRGYSIPRDVAITGYDDFVFATVASPRLTTYKVDTERMAKAVVAQLHRKIRKKALLVNHSVIGGQMIRREST